MKTKGLLQLLLVTAIASLQICCAKSDPTLEFYGSANHFTQTEQKAFGGVEAIENSMVELGGSIVSFYDPRANGSMWMADLGIDGRGFSNPRPVLTGNARFSYVFKYDSVLYNFVTRGDVHLLTSIDGINWTERGVVLTASADRQSVYHQIWNVGVAVDDAGTFHLLAETSDATPDQRGVGLAYARATLSNGTLNFDLDRSSSHVVPHGGNPFLANVPGKGILAIHGQAWDPNGVFGNEWYVTASTLSAGGVWKTHKDKLTIGAPGVHVCDPHAIEVSGRILLTMSVDQNSIYKSEAPIDFQTMFNELTRD